MTYQVQLDEAKLRLSDLAPVYKLWLILRVFLTCRIEEKTCNVLEYI